MVAMAACVSSLPLAAGCPAARAAARRPMPEHPLPAHQVAHRRGWQARLQPPALAPAARGAPPTPRWPAAAGPGDALGGEGASAAGGRGEGGGPPRGEGGGPPGVEGAAWFAAVEQLHRLAAASQRTGLLQGIPEGGWDSIQEGASCLDALGSTPEACRAEAALLEEAAAYLQGVRLSMARAGQDLRLAAIAIKRERINPSLDRAIRGEAEGQMDLVSNIPDEAGDVGARLERLDNLQRAGVRAREEVAEAFRDGCSRRWLAVLPAEETIALRATMREAEAGREQEVMDLRTAQQGEEWRAGLLPSITGATLRVRFWMHEVVLENLLPGASEGEALALWGAGALLAVAATAQVSKAAVVVSSFVNPTVDLVL